MTARRRTQRTKSLQGCICSQICRPLLRTGVLLAGCLKTRLRHAFFEIMRERKHTRGGRRLVLHASFVSRQARAGALKPSLFPPCPSLQSVPCFQYFLSTSTREHVCVSNSGRSAHARRHERHPHKTPSRPRLPVPINHLTSGSTHAHGPQNTPQPAPRSKPERSPAHNRYNSCF